MKNSRPVQPLSRRVFPLSHDARSATQQLLQLRMARGFDTREVAEAKGGRMARFFAANGLDAAVVGVSGGVDSALVLALLQQCVRAGVLKRVIALLMPIESVGATRQAEASARGRLVANALGAELWEAPLAHAHAALVAALTQASQQSFTPWAEGQALSVMRTPALYGAAALLQTQGLRSLVVGTTNRDEGAYLGFFGKASDGMVDLQPISDLHKSEVRALARYLSVPEEIVAAVPSGDVYDGRSDEDMIGASYDDIELSLRLRELGYAALSDAAPNAAAIARQHAQNHHKYRIGNPAVHLDVLPRAVPGGWPDEALSPRSERRPPADTLPGAWDPPPIALDPLGPLPEVEHVAAEGLVICADGVLTAHDCAGLRDAMALCEHAEPVGVTGIRDGYGVGSTRATAWSEALASQLWQRLSPAVPSVRFLNAFSPTDAFQTATRAGHRSWRVVGLSPLLRFMRYEPGGRHLCHYDAGFDYGDGRRTLLSVVFYLTDAALSGATRFVSDGQASLPVSARDFSDWATETREDQVHAAISPRVGRAVIFDHRLCHDVQRWEGPGPRVIIRADVVYEAIPDGRP